MADNPELGKFLNEGKTKMVYELPGCEGRVVLKFKSVMAADDGVRYDGMRDKAIVSTTINDNVFKLLNYAGVNTAYVERHSEDAFIARQCDMIPIEWAVRRQPFASFLRRNPHMKAGQICCPPPVELSFKDDENHDPVWSEEQVIAAKFKAGPKVIGRNEVEIMKRMTVTTFEILERAWASLNCSLIDIKVEFGVTSAGDILLADVIENDAWRLWESGDPSKMKDWQLYQTMFENNEITDANLEIVRQNYVWVAEKSEGLMSKPRGRVAVITDAASSTGHCDKLREVCLDLGVSCDVHVTSDHTGPQDTRKLLAEYEGDAIPTVLITMGACKNTVDLLLENNVSFPVINCQPGSVNGEAKDVRSSLYLPSGLACPTVLSAEVAALQSAQILGLTDHMIWSKIRARDLNCRFSRKQAEMYIREN